MQSNPAAIPASRRESRVTLGRSWFRWVFVAITFGFVWTRRGDLLASIAVFPQLRVVPLVIALGLSGLAIVNRGALNRAAHQAIGMDANLGSMTRVSAAAYALNKMVKTGGLGGIALFVRHGKSKNRPAPDVAAAYLLAASCSQVALLTVALIAIISASATGTLTGGWLIGALIVAGIGACALAAAAYLVGDINLVRRVCAVPYRIRSWLTLRRGGASHAVPDPGQADRIYALACALRQSPRPALVVFAHAVAAKLLGASVLAASLAASGAPIGTANTLTVYSVALVAAMIGILPGGLGAVEASMALVLGTFGTESPAAIAAVTAFRLLDLWLPLGAGLVAFRGLDRCPRPTAYGSNPATNQMPTFS